MLEIQQNFLSVSRNIKKLLHEVYDMRELWKKTDKNVKNRAAVTICTKIVEKFLYSLCHTVHPKCQYNQ